MRPPETAIMAAAFEKYGKRATMSENGHLRSDPDVLLLAHALVQRAEGRTGGGPECPMCGERTLRPMPHAAGPGMYLCGSDGTFQGGSPVGCGYGVRVIVSGGGLKLEAIAR